MNHSKTIENSKIGELCTHIVTTKHVKRGDQCTHIEWKVILDLKNLAKLRQTKEIQVVPSNRITSK